ncbi:hypothetical protein GCM10007350_37360 [Jeongeupia chitinilytica]|uniref:Fimbrial-type adhesion domain-containing protein n=2 Tax=Jeongeupia chitinilytica TaxID=1041641 RepID=A0ABQ3H8A1_9NEIS|nr:hypothetical protein GCM10007350_37360 [Jeongeupia chitinilytica]
MSAPTINLGTHKSTEMAAVGDVTTPAVAVPISLACPAGIATVQYRIDPSYGTVATNVAKLDGSGATGYGVQLLTSGGSVLNLGTNYTMSPFSGAGNYTINLQARYYRSGTTVTPGAANTTMTVTATFQ